MLCSLDCCGRICLPLSLACIGLLSAFYRVIITGNHDALEIYTDDDASTAQSTLVEAIEMYCVTLFLSILCLIPECRRKRLVAILEEDSANPTLPLLDKHSIQGVAAGADDFNTERATPIGFDLTSQYVLTTP